MKSPWITSVVPIAIIFSFRMLGLFMLIPVFTLYANDLESATPGLIGLALGAYGLSQGLLQIPFGLLSDKFGRKRVIAIGLWFFISGSLLGAISHSIYGIITARILQGVGAIGSVLIALLADLTPENHRTKAMAIIGSSIGISFLFAMVLSPTLAQCYGLSGIFYVMTTLASLGLILLFFIPHPPRTLLPVATTNIKLVKQVLYNRNLLNLNLGIFCQHFILTSTFFVLPLLIHKQIEAGHLSHQWQFYLTIMISSFICMTPFIVLAERQAKNIFLISTMLIAFSQCLLNFIYETWLGVCFCMFIYFLAFNILEASLPALISKQAPPESKGTAMGVYSSFQFLGIFAGGSMAGLLFPILHSKSIFILNSIIAGLWLFLSFKIQDPISNKKFKNAFT